MTNELEIIEVSRVCRKCGESKPIKDFYRHKDYPGGRKTYCKKCENRMVTEWRRKHPEKSRKLANDSYHRRKHLPEMIAKLRRKNLAIYGITIEHYEAMLESQNGVCAICEETEPGKTPLGKEKMLAVDHDHDTGEVRGLLCSRCNQAIGGMRESEKLIKRMLKYLRHHRKAK